MRLGALAEALGCRVEGGPEIKMDLEIASVASLASAGERDLAFLTDPRQAPQAAATRAAALLVGFDFPAFDRQPPLGWLRAERPDVAVAPARNPAP
ncbi:MAG: LpxD N-terminal domain-containing protein [Terriglobales bacterium]